MKVRFRSRARVTASAIATGLFRDTSAGVALLSSTGQIIRANAEFVSLCSVGDGEASGEKAILPPPYEARLQAAIISNLPDRFRADFTNPAGERRALQVTITPLPDGAALLRLSDHSHERDLEEQLAQTQRLQAVGELAGGIAHDFNNLLTVVLGSTDVMLLRACSEDDREELEQIRASTERGAALVRQLLAFSRQQTLQPRLIALNDAITATVLLLRRVIGAGVSLRIALEEPGRRVMIDPTQLDQVLINLAVNASHAMPEGGVLTIATGHRLLLKADAGGGEVIPPGRYASIEVADTGQGIPPDVLPRIFEPFFTTRRDEGGTGLGLSTVHGIVRQSGGYLSVESRPGAGTRFLILLPRHEAVPWKAEAAQAKPSKAVSGAPAGEGRTVLLVEDEAPVRRLAERALAAQGWRVLTAGCAEEAFEVTSADPEHPPLSCVVSDVVMPGVDGPSMVKTLRNIYDYLPAIMVSGYADQALRDRLSAMDVMFLPKPFATRDLVAAVNTACSGHKLPVPLRV